MSSSPSPLHILTVWGSTLKRWFIDVKNDEDVVIYMQGENNLWIEASKRKFIRCKTKKNRLYSLHPSNKQIKAQNDIAKKQYQGLNKFFQSDGKEEPTLKMCYKSDLIYNNKYSFYQYYRYCKRFHNLSFKSKLLLDFLKELIKFNKLKTQKEKYKEKKTNVHDTASELYNVLLGTYFDE